MSADSRQIGGIHYKTADPNGMQHWTYCALQNIAYLEGCATKYLMRWRSKGGLADLEKALHYVEKRVEMTNKPALEFNCGCRTGKLFDDLIADNNIPDREAALIDTIMHWRSKNELKLAGKALAEFLLEMRNEQGQGPQSHGYVDQE